MIVYRLSSSRYARDLCGRGSELAGGRWNNKGTALIYTSQSRALCMLEVAVHLPLGNLPLDYHLVSIELPDISLPVVEISSLGTAWKAWPPSSHTRHIGDEFVKEGKHLGLRVPSAIVPEEFNVLINPKHGDMTRVKIIHTEPFSFDSRLFTR